MIRLFVSCRDVAAVMAAGYTHIYVFSDTVETGTFATAVGTITLVANTESYEYTATSGTTATWYKTAYYGAVPGLGTKGDARKGETRRAYATVKELRYHTGKTLTGDDVEIAQLLDSAAMAIDNYCGRPDGFMAEPNGTARAYIGSGTPVQRIDECVSISLVAVKDSPTDAAYTAWTTDDWDAFAGDPTNPNLQPTAQGKPYTGLMVTADGDYSDFTSGKYNRWSVPTVQVTARWGYSDAVPDAIRQACLIQAARWYKRGQSAWADTLASPDFGQLMYRQKVDPDVAMILQAGRYIRPAVG